MKFLEAPFLQNRGILFSTLFWFTVINLFIFSLFVFIIKPKGQENAYDFLQTLKSNVSVSKELKLSTFQNVLDVYKENHQLQIKKHLVDKNKKGGRFVLCEGINDLATTLDIYISCILFGIISQRTVLLQQESEINFSSIFHYSSNSFATQRENLNLPHYSVLLNPNELACSNLSNLHKDDILIQLPGKFSFVGSILQNPTHKLYKIIPENWFSLIFQYFFQINPTLINKVRTFLQNNFTEYVFGIEIDAPRLTPKSINDPPKELVFQAVETLSRQSSIPYEKITWFLVTQNNHIANWFKTQRKEGSVIWYPPAIEVNDKEKAWVLSELFFLCLNVKDMIVPELSSFSQVAASINSIKPVVCNPLGFCLRRLTSFPSQESSTLHNKAIKCNSNIFVYPAPDMSSHSMKLIDQRCNHCYKG